MKTKLFGVNEIYATGHDNEDGNFYIDMNVQSNTNNKSENIVLVLNKHQINDINNINNFYSIQNINNWIINNEKTLNMHYKMYKKTDKNPLSFLSFALLTFEHFKKNKNKNI